MARESSSPEREVHGQLPHERERIMKLFTRLLISHAIPVLVVTVALALSLVALLRISVVLTTLNDKELATLGSEGALHAAAWEVDVAMRHAHVACARGRPDEEVRKPIEEKARKLRSVLQKAPPVPSSMRLLADGYLVAAGEVDSGSACEKLLGAALQERRAQLDEQLTNVWVDRLAELHRAVSEKDGQARQIAVFAVWLGIPLAIASFVIAMLIARHMTRVVTSPLASLAQTAQRVGRGDFQTPVEIAGPAEILALAEELERMRAQLQQLETLKQGFLASVSHELRTPLSKIREALALLQDGAVGPIDERQTRVLQIARTACEREIRMVTTLLDLSRLRAGSPIQLRDGCAIDAVLQRVMTDERAEAQSRGVHLELTTEGESKACRLDPVLMECAVGNIIRNAVAVSSRGQRVRVVRSVESVTGEADRVQDWVRIRVSDEGPGVPEDIRSTIFDAFVTRSVPRSGKALGIGIGLALAREVALAHGGELTLLSSERRGSSFELRVPLADMDRRGEGAAGSLSLSPGIFDVRRALS